MKKVLLVIGIILFAMPGYSQNSLMDSLRGALKNEKTDTGRAVVLNDLSSAYQIYKPDSALLLAQEAYELSKKNHFLKGESWALYMMAGAFSRLGNYPQSLEYFFNQLKIEEQRGFPDNIANININIALVYSSEKDADKALFYALKADSIIKKNGISDLTLYSLLNVGDIYEKANKLSDALAYTKECYKQALKDNNNLFIGSALNNLGNIYLKTGDIEQAIVNYRLASPYLAAMQDNQSISECYLGLSNAFDKSNMQDSAMYFAIQAYNVSYKNGFLKNALEASLFLSRLYKKENRIDSAFAYHEIMATLKDSIESIEKIKQVESITIEEQLRQKELAEQIEQDKKDRREKLELLAVGIMIPIFFLTTLYISRKKVHSRVIKFSGIVSLLLMFEYITLLIQPFIANMVNHSPVLEVIIFACIAALIIPTHHKIEAWFIRHLTNIHEKHTHTIATLPAENAGDEIAS